MKYNTVVEIIEEVETTVNTEEQPKYFYQSAVITANSKLKIIFMNITSK